MRIEDIREGDVLVSTDRYGSGYYKVLKVNPTTIRVRAENGNETRAYPHLFDRKIDYLPEAFA